MRSIKMKNVRESCFWPLCIAGIFKSRVLCDIGARHCAHAIHDIPALAHVWDGILIPKAVKVIVYITVDHLFGSEWKPYKKGHSVGPMVLTLLHWLTAKKGVHQFRIFLSPMRTPDYLVKPCKCHLYWPKSGQFVINAHVCRDNSLIFCSTLVYALLTGRT